MTSTETALPSTALPLFTVADAAETLGVSLTYMYDRIRDNTMATVNLGSDKKPKLRIRADSLQAFIQARTTPAAKP